MTVDKSGLFDEMEEVEDISLQQILNNLLNAENNLNLKSQVERPKELASLFILSKYLKQYNFKNSGELLQLFINTFLEYMISYKREGRKEIIRALTNLIENEKKNISKLTENLSE